VQPGIQIPQMDFPHSSDPELSHEIFIADLNGDGKPDIARSNVVILGNGDGTFQPPPLAIYGPATQTAHTTRHSSAGRHNPNP
jgi:hypothetical protein